MNYITIFDASADPYYQILFVAPGVLLTVIGAILVFRPEWTARVRIRVRPLTHFICWVFFVGSLLWTAEAIDALAADIRRTDRVAKGGHCRIIEGRVERFHPMPYTGHDTESFYVNGINFHYSDYELSDGFNNTASHGGPIREGLPVRICYRDDLGSGPIKALADLVVG